MGRARFDFTVTDAAGHSWTQTCALVVTNTGLPRELLWKGAGAVWDESALHWLRPANGATVAFSAGDRVSFDDSGLAQPNVSLSGNLAPTTVEINATGHYTFSGSGSVASTGTLAKRGPGTLTLTTSHTYTGGGTLEAGTVLFGTGGTLGGGFFNLLRDITLTNNYPAGTTLAVGASFDVPAGNTATLNTGNRLAYGGALSGAGTLQLNVQTSVSRFDLLGPAAGLTGELRFTGSGGTRLFFNGGNFNGFDQAHVRLDGAVSLLPQTNSGGNALNIGTLSGTHASATLGGGSAGPVAYTIGARGGDTTFAGAITGNASLSKVGSGTLTLGGTSSYTGATTVNGGALLVDGALGNTAVTVASGALLGGSGTFGGAVTAQNGAFLSPGTVPFTGASMTVNGGLTLGAATLYYDLSGTPAGANDQIVMGGGVLTFSAAPHFQFLLLDGTLAPGTYTLISGGTNTSAPTSPTLTHNLPTGTRQTFTLQRSGSGSGQGFVRLVVSGNPATLTWTGAASADWDTASANWSGATPNTFYPNDAVIFDDTSTVNAIATPAAVAPRSVLFSNATRAYTLSGAGLTGSAVLIKSGPGALTLTGANAHTGGTTIQAGATITLANDTANAGALGSGPITFLGGKLAMYSSTTGFSGSTWHLAVPAGQTGTLEADARHDLYGSLTGGGTLHFYVPWIRTNLYADWSAFTGQIQVTTDADGGELRLATNYAFPGFPAAHVDLGPKVVARYEGILAQGAGTTIELGALAGGSQATLLGGPASSGARALTYVVGGRGSDATFAGAIAEQDAAVTRTALVKTGAGTWTLAGPCTHRGATTVAAGTLRFTTGGTLQNDAPITVAAGATLALHGGSLVCDSVNIAAGGTFTSTGGSLTGEVQNAGTLNLTGGTLVVQGDLVNTGTLRVTGLASLQVTGSVINEGLLDLLTAASTLPANFTNNGIIIENSARRILSVARTGPNFTCTAHGYAGHAYQLQRADTLAGPWVNVGGAQAGAGAVLTFTDPGGATGPQRFYRLLVTP
jgi:autotransporter-associated beta strand protein